VRARLIVALTILFVSTAEADDPIDRSGGWDVDGPLGPERAEFRLTTDEGTWMNLDVHPDGTVIVFDLLGDLYLLPIAGGQATRLTSGAAYDLQPRFSPDGRRLLFNSDRGGVNSVWIADFDGESLSEFRNLNEGSSNTINGANWLPDGDWILARKRVTDTSSIGVAELWMYHVDGGNGVQVISPKAELDSFHATRDGRYIYLGASGPFSYGRNPYGVVWGISRFDRVTGEQQVVTQGNGSAAAPVLSPDETTLAFVRRVGNRSTLWLHDIATGSERQLWDGLDRDQIESFGTNYIYPTFDFTPGGDDLVVWAGGKIMRVPVNGDEPSLIPFEADIETPYHAPLRFDHDPAPETLEARMIRWPVISPDGEALVFQALGRLYWMRLPDGTPQRVTDAAVLEFAPSFSPDGRSLAYTTWSDTDGATLRTLSWRGNGPGGGRTVHESGTQLVNPAWSPDGDRLLVVAGSGASLRGEDLGVESRHDILLLDADGRGDAALIVSTGNRGSARRVTRPSFSADGERIWYYEDGAPGSQERGQRKPPQTVLVSVRLDGTDKREHMKFRYAQEVMVSPAEDLVAFTEQHNAWVAALPKAGAAVDLDPNGAAVPFSQLSRDGGEWVTWSPDGERLSFAFANKVTGLQTDSLTLGGKAAPRQQGDDGVLVLEVGIAADGSFTYAGTSGSLGDVSAALERDIEPAAQARVDVTIAEGGPWSAWKALESWAGEAKVGVRVAETDDDEAADDSDEDEAESDKQEYVIDLTVPRTKPSGTVAFTGARLITMNGDEVIENGTLVVHDNRIVAAGSGVDVPSDARVFDVSGKTIMPGLIDVHAHMGYGVLDVNPQKEWRYFANLAYGVTTTHDPSASTHTVFSQSEMIEAGVMVGPRIYSTGFILYGADTPDKAFVTSYADALSHVRRLKALGAFSVKSYMQPKREQRQWIIRAAAAEQMQVMPEGGGDFPANMGMLLDGHSSIEHSLSIGQIYDDVVQLFATTRAGYTATLLVAYGGQMGENYFYQHDDVWKNEKLQSFFPPRQIDARARRRLMSDDDDWNHMLIAEGLRKISEAGGLVTLGAHGQLQGLGAHWELWAIAQGGMTTHDALRAATINGAEYLGMEDHLGSLEAGKLADFIVLDANPLDDIENSAAVSMTIANGVVYDSDTMNEVWPVARERAPFHFQR